MKFSWVILLSLISSLAYGQQKKNLTILQGPIEDNTYLSTVKITKSVHQIISKKIKNKYVKVDTMISATGTGFFVFRVMPNSTYKIFLVTNKHMIGDWTLNDSLLVHRSISVNFYTKENLFKNIVIPLKDDKGNIAANVHPYPNQVVDVAVIDITDFLIKNSTNDIAVFAISINNLISLSKLAYYNIYTGSQVLITGYPSGVGIASQSKPIVKSAIISFSLD